MTSSVRASYTGTFEHDFDEKGRITVPSEWRRENFEKALTVLPSQGACLKVYPESWLGEIQQSMLKLPHNAPGRQAMELLASRSQAVEIDPQGRIGVKVGLREGASLTNRKNIVMVGRMDHFQIWDKTVYELKYPAAAAMTMEEALTQLGL